MSGALVMIVAACGGSDASDSASVPASSEAGVTESSQPLEAVLVPTASGGQLDFNSLRGQDVLLWFWAPW
jgi:hypothetical protein